MQFKYALVKLIFTGKYLMFVYFYNTLFYLNTAQKFQLPGVIKTKANFIFIVVNCEALFVIIWCLIAIFLFTG